MSLKTFSELLRLSRSQWWSRQALEELQLQRLQLIVQHAVRYSPFYRDLYAAAGLENPVPASLAEMQNLPVIDKQMLYDASPETLLSEHCDKEGLHVTQTGGSTGRSLNIYMSKAQRKRRVASIYRTQFANGYRPWHKLLYVQPYPGGAGAIEKLGLFRSLGLDIQQSPENWLPMILREQPQFLSGFANSISEIAQLVKRENADYKPIAAFCNSENLSQNRARHIREGLGIEPCNVYDCWEFGNVAWECAEHSGLHVSADLLFVEINERGNLLITDLYNTEMPLIRYNIGDSAEWQDGKCACGRGLPLIKNIVGKANDIVVLADGSEDYCSYRLAVSIFNALPDFIELQVQQQQAGELEVLLQHRGDWPAAKITELEQSLATQFRLNRVRFHNSFDFYRTEIGKRPIFYSALHHNK